MVTVNLFDEKLPVAHVQKLQRKWLKFVIAVAKGQVCLVM
jgi:hypothetical protein